MRILQAFEPPEGGVRAHVLTLTRELMARGHDVEVAVTTRSEDAGHAFADLGARVHTADLAREIHALGANARGFAQLLAILRAGGYDVVHLHDAKAGALGRPAAWFARTPVVYSPHGFVYQSQHLRDRRARGARRALTLGIERALAPLSRAILCVSEDERTAAIRDGVATAERFHLVYGGVPLDSPTTPDPQLQPFRGDGPLVGFLGRLEEEKGPAVLIDALRLLSERGTLPKVAIVGNGSLSGWIGNETAELGDRVRVIPFTSEAGAYLAAFDLLVMPSVREGLPLVALEAMAAGVPILASAINGIPEAVIDGESGVLVPPADPNALADAMEALVRAPEQLAAMGAAGRERCTEHFALATMIDRIEAIYGEAAC